MTILRHFRSAFAALASIHVWQGQGRFMSGGDVVHYMTQLDNLLERGNLDLSERLEHAMRKRKVPREEKAAGPFPEGSVVADCLPRIRLFKNNGR